jgi:hypothetical protein
MISVFNRCDVVLGVVLLVCPAKSEGVVLNQVDNFQNGTTQGWDTGVNDPSPPVNIATGGPTGSGDEFLELTSLGGSGAGSKLVAFNKAQWIGNYLSAGVTSISANLNNLGATALDIRLILEGPGGNFVSSTAAHLAAGSGWQLVQFPLDAVHLTGGANLSQTLGGVATLDLVHAPTTVTSRSGSPAIAAQLGVDNLTAVPEPTALAHCGFMLACLAFGFFPKIRRR